MWSAVPPLPNLNPWFSRQKVGWKRWALGSLAGRSCGWVAEKRQDIGGHLLCITPVEDLLGARMVPSPSSLIQARVVAGVVRSRSDIITSEITQSLTCRLLGVCHVIIHPWMMGPLSRLHSVHDRY